MTYDIAPRAVARLTARAGWRGRPALEPLPGGANNRVFRVRAAGRCALLKAYFRHPADPRDRLAAEFAFSTFAWDHGLRCVPQPLACAPRDALGLYEFVSGRALRPGEINRQAVAQALAFFGELNRHKSAPGARALPAASEACFSVAGHLACVARRVRRLESVSDPAAAAFIQDELAPCWRGIAKRARADEDARLAPAERCISPSDFGFHNALREDSGRLRFFDFEYAGWDDPAKMVCDFFCQPALPVPRDFYELVVDAAVAGLARPGLHARRIARLLPAYRIKWCCILLNDFLPAGRRRRRFLRRGDEAQARAGQLVKARLALDQLGARL